MVSVLHHGDKAESDTYEWGSWLVWGGGGITPVCPRPCSGWGPRRSTPSPRACARRRPPRWPPPRWRCRPPCPYIHAAPVEPGTQHIITLRPSVSN